MKRERETETEMKYLEVEGAGRLEVEGWCRRDSGSTSRRGRSIRAPSPTWQSPSSIRQSVGSGVLELSILGLWVRFFSLDFRLGFFLSFKCFPLVFYFNILGFVLFFCFFFFIFMRIRGFALPCFFFFRLGLLYRLMLGFFS